MNEEETRRFVYWQHSPSVSPASRDGITWANQYTRTEVHQTAGFYAAVGQPVPPGMPPWLVLCVAHQTIVPATQEQYDLGLTNTWGSDPTSWCQGCRNNVIVAIPEPEPEPEEPPVAVVPAIPEPEPEPVLPYAEPEPEAVIPAVPEEAETFEQAAVDTPFAMPEEEPQAAKPAAKVKSTVAAPAELYHSVTAAYLAARRDIEAREAEIEVLKEQAAKILEPLAGYVPSWEYNGLWYQMSASKTGRPFLKGPADKKPGRQPKE